MEPKKSKYDTNPLDPDFVKKTEELGRADDGDPITQGMRSGATREIGSAANENARGNVYSEAPTRRYDNLPLDSPYQSVFVPPTYSQAAPYQPSPAPYRPVTQRPTARSIPGLGLPEKWAIMLPYAPFYLGVVVSLIELFLVPKSEPKVRFHASQGLALHIAILLVQTVLSVVGAIANSSAGGSLFGLAALIFLIISMVRVWKGEPHYIAPVAEPAKWFDEHIKPRSNS
jgi:uncharacterized membrane protein